MHAGAAASIASLLVSAGELAGGNASIQIAVYVATVLMSSVVANNAAAALMYPIAIKVAVQRGIRTDLMAFLLMLAASASFAVPFGYQTNLMVYGAGGYTFSDFFRFGGPLQVSLSPLEPLLCNFGGTLRVCLSTTSKVARCGALKLLHHGLEADPQNSVCPGLKTQRMRKIAGILALEPTRLCKPGGTKVSKAVVPLRHVQTLLGILH